jgi:protein CpxP
MVMTRRLLPAVGLLLISMGVASAHAAGAPDSDAAAGPNAVSRPTPARHAQHRARRALDDRVATYTKELNLDAKQQSQLRALLLQQREQVLRVWNDTSLPAAQRVHATGVISDATADGIRAMLTEEQRKKYNPPRPPHESTAQPGAPSAADWINAANSR